MAEGNWLNAIARPQVVAIRKYVGNILQDRYPKHEELLDRIATALITQSDVESFSRFIVDIYEIAYLKCVDDHRKTLEQAGHKIVIKEGSPTNAKTIFSN